jgi:hypothetical protein
MLKKLLVTTALMAGLAAPASAAVITDFGVNPRGNVGIFANDPNGGPNIGGVFSDQYTFELDGASFITVASATNSYPGGLPSTDFISGFNASVYEIVGDIGAGGGADILVLGPAFANVGDESQELSGRAILGAGNYYLQIEGNAGITAGYGGNFATVPLAAVPEPATWFMMIMGFAGIGVMAMRKQQLRLA